MSRIARLSTLLALLALPITGTSCGDDGGGSSPDARVSPGADAAIEPDAGGAAPDAMIGSPDAMTLGHGIDVARAAADGVVDLAITEVLVTYLKPAIGNDLAGFFVQAEPTGPALFIAVDPATLTTPVTVGDEVSFTITEMDTSGALRQATAISGEVILSAANAIDGLIQDVSAAADLVTNLDDYESELVAAQFTVTANFSGAGTGYQAGVIETSAVTASPDLRLRLPEALQTSIGLVPTCAVSVTATPVWRFASAIQLSAWDLAELDITCPPPLPVEAAPVTTTQLTIEFDRSIDPASLVADGSQFTFDNGLIASAATVDGRVVTITTTVMGNVQQYTATMATTLLDVLGQAIAAPGNTIMFTSLANAEVVCDDGLDDDLNGYIDCQDAACANAGPCAFLSQLYLWEVDADDAGGDDVEFVEIWNNTNATIDLFADGYYLLFLNGNGEVAYKAVALSGDALADGLYVAGSDNAVLAADQVIGTTNIMQNGADGVLLVECPTCTDAATDFPENIVVGTNATFTTDGGQTATKIDALAYDTNDGDDAELLAALGVIAQFDENANGNKDTESNNRTSLFGWSAQLSNPKQSGVE